MKGKKIIILIIILLIIFFLYSTKIVHNKNATRIPVITFHRLVNKDIKEQKYKDNVWVGSIEVFEEMMKYLYDNGYKTIGSKELYKWYNKEFELPKKTVMITFDDGFYEDYYLAYPIIKKYNFKAISFLVGERIKDVTPAFDENDTEFIGKDVIDKVYMEYPNFEFQSHSYNLHYYTKNKKHAIKSKSLEELDIDIKKSLKYNFNVMAYPFGDYNDNIKKVLKDNNYIMAFRFTPSAYVTRDSDIYELPRIKMDATKTLKDLKAWLE